MKNVNNKRRFALLTLGILIMAGFSSCNTDNGNYPVIHWINPLSTKYENPSISDRAEDGLLEMILYQDYTLTYAIKVYNLKSGDQLTGAGFFAGDVMTNGNVILPLNATFNGNYASGSVKIRPSLADSLMYISNQIYVNIFSTDKPEGLVRGQINTDIIYSGSISLSGDNEIPPVVNPATGSAVVRVTMEGGASKKVYFNITVANLSSDDVLMSAGIYTGDATQTSPAPYITLCESAAQFNSNQSTAIANQTIYPLINKEPSYVNVITQNQPDGLLRGQIQNDYLNPLFQ